jgi:hypothetical protein
VSPVSCDLISLTYEDGGEPRQVLISPMEGWIGVPSSRNAFAAEWHAAIKSAVLAATGRAPGSTPANELGISQGSSWPHLLLILFPVVVTVLLIVMIVGPVPAGFTKEQMLIGTIVILLLMPLSFHWWIRRQAPPVPHAPARPPQSRGQVWGMVGSALGMTSWMVVTAVLSGWRGTGVALTTATVGTVLAAALVLWKSRNRMSPLIRQMGLIAIGFVSTAAFLVGAHWLGLSMISRWPGGVTVSPLKFVWALALFPLIAVWHWFFHRLTNERGASTDGSSRSGPPLSDKSEAQHSRWQGWDVWVIGLCLTIFGALWLLQLSEGPLLNRSLFVGAGAGSNVVLPVALATTILLAGAAFLYMLARNIRTASPKRAESWKRTLGRTVVPAIAVALLLRTFVLAPFWSVTDAAGPEIPKGSLVLVWKLTRNFAPGDLIAYADESKGHVSLGRIDKPSQGAVFVKRNNSEPTSVLDSNIVGKVISVIWRGTQENPPDAIELIRIEERGKTRDGRDFVMIFEELQRHEKTSIVTIKAVNGGSVGSAMFMVQGACDIAKARGAACFINLKEWEGKDGAWMYLMGFAPDKGVDPITYFELKEPLPAEKRHQFFSVKDYAPLFNRQP